MAIDSDIVRLLETLEEIGGFSELIPEVEGLNHEEAGRAADVAQRRRLIEGRATRSAGNELLMMLNIVLTEQGRQLLRDARGDSPGSVNFYGPVSNPVVQTGGAGSSFGGSTQVGPPPPPEERLSAANKAWRWFTSSTRIVVLGTVSAALAAGIIVVITDAYSGPSHGTPAGTAVPNEAVLEYSDNHQGSPVFADRAGDPVKGVAARIPFGTKVYVTCEIPNTSDQLGTVHAFYLIASGPWRDDYVVSDTMSNGGPPGNTTSPNVDPRVKRCP
jgi:hypothetical protein